MAFLRSSSTATSVEIEEEMPRWHPIRRALYAVVSSPLFEGSLAALVIINVVFVIIETNAAAVGESPPPWMEVGNMLVMAMYVVEVSLRIFVRRGRFCMDFLSMFDLCVILVDLVVTMCVMWMAVQFPFPTIMLRTARVLKVTRILRMMAMFPELNLMLRGMVFAAKAILWGVVMLGIVLCFWSILAVMYIHPLNRRLSESGFWASQGCERCPQAYASVQQSMLTFVQEIVVGDEWGTMTMPFIQEHPETSLFFIPVLASVSLALMNLIFAVIVERANEARSMTLRQEAQRKEKEYALASSKLVDLCKQLDTDRSGTISFAELQEGYRVNEEFSAILRVMDVQEADLEVVFSMLDADGSGDVGYEEFVEQLHMMKDREAHTLLVFIKFYVMEIRQLLTGIGASKSRWRRRSGGSNLDKLARGHSESSAASCASCHHVASGSTLAGNVGVIADGCAQPLEPQLCGKALADFAEAVSSTSASWPELEAELKGLQSIRQEMLEFSSIQADRLDTLQRRLASGLGGAPEERAPKAMALDPGPWSASWYDRRPCDEGLSLVPDSGGRIARGRRSKIAASPGARRLGLRPALSSE